MERQKLIRMTERSERMYLRGDKGRGKISSELERESAAHNKFSLGLAFAGRLLPHGDVDDDEEQQGERRDPAAHDEGYGWQQSLVHHL